jgi:antitoxin HicB
MGDVVASIPDVPEAITQRRADAGTMAEKAVALAIPSNSERSLPLPKPRAKGRAFVEIAVVPDLAAKPVAVEACKPTGISKNELARRLSKDEKEARRILVARRRQSARAGPCSRALGKRLVVGVWRRERRDFSNSSRSEKVTPPSPSHAA